MYRCAICGVGVAIQDIKYHTAGRDKVFCGPQCSLAHYQQLKEKKDGE
jgi:hypothetical protein|tara:strand:- start:1697 stop:1840 length:144 start_codon:yes stop_codon:yes gene_type:complete